MKNSMSVLVYLRSRLAHLPVITFALLITVVLSTPNAYGQSVLDSGTPVGLAPGAPAGSYALSEIENINLFSGNLNFTLPLLKINGRGGAQSAIMLPIESHWTNWYLFRHEVSGAYYNPIPMYNFNPAASLKPGYGPGVLIPRFSEIVWGVSNACSGGQSIWDVETQTRLTFIAGDGTEFELRDTLHDGAPLHRWCSQPVHSRGTTFVTKDGSAATFISDTVILDGPGGGPVSGYLMLRNGTRYRIDNGLVTWISDRNGNRITYTYTNGRVTLIKDSLNREITIEYGINDIAPYGLCDRIRFKGSGGQERIIRVSYSQLSSSLASGYTLLTKTQMFTPPFPPDFVSDSLNTTNFDTQVVSSVWLPDDGVNTRRYKFLYNGYGELARAELPTGGSYEYVWETTPFMEYDGSGYPQELLRRVKTRRVINGSAVEQKTSYSYSLPATRNGTTVVTVDRSDDSQPAHALSQEKHYFYGTPIPLPFQLGSASLFRDSPWTTGREYQTDFLGPNGSPLLRRITQTWRQRAAVSWCTGIPQSPCTQDTAPANDPRVVETITTLADTNQVSKRTSIDPQDLSGQTVGFDQFNNPTDVWEYDFGPGAPGALLRRSHTDYVTAANYVNANADPTLGAHLRSLPSQHWISSDASGATKASLTIFEYDNYSNDTRHKPLVLRPNITGHDTTYSGSFTTRGNLTGTTSYASAQSQSGPVTQSAQFDIAGNVVAIIDGLQNVSTVTFGDSFCNGTTCGGSFTANTYAFMIAATSPVPDPTGQHGSTTALSTTQVYDFWTGHHTSKTDSNGQTTNFQYNDVLDRPTAIVRPTGGGRTDFEYGDSVGNLFVRTLSDLDSGRRTDSYQYFDGFGRVIESRTYENSAQYIAVKHTPFVMQQDPDSSLWLAASQTSNPFRQGEQPIWTTTFVDALSRPTKVRTPDNSIVRTTYSGNSVSVSDQAGKVRKSISDALGRLIRVYEDPNGLNYETSYLYDALDNLVKVTQGTQQRFFMYDSLRRLLRSRNPEHGTLASLNLSDPLTGNGAWSTGYQYDANSNLTQKTDARGVVSTYTYDALNRQKTLDYSDTSLINPDVTRIYDGATHGKGKLWKTYAGGGESVGSDVEKTLLESYDALGRPTVLKQFFKVSSQWSSNSPYVMSRTYNLAGGVTGQTYPSGRTLTYNYDNAGRLGDKDAQNPAFSGNLGDGQTRTYSKGIVYASAGQIQQEQFGTTTPVYNKLRYNSRQQLAEILTSTTGGDSSWNRGKILNQYSLQCSGTGCNATDNNGNLRKQEVFIPSDDQVSSSTSWYQQYDYDELNRLKRVHEYTSDPQKDWQQEYLYDRWGNRTIDDHITKTYGLGINNKKFEKEDATNRLYADGDLVLADNLRRIRYDAAGNQIKDTFTGYGTATFDGENRLVTIQNNQAGSSSFSYDAEGQRTRRKTNGQEIWQIYGFEGELLAEYSTNGAANTPTKEYGYRNGQLLVTAEPVTALNVALASNGAVATASSAYDPVVCSSTAASANDGDRTGRARCNSHVWNDAAPANTFPDWLQIDFNGSKTITEIDVITVQDHLEWPVEPTEAMTFSLYGLTAYQVQYWNGSGWVTIPAGSISGNNKVWRKFSFSAITTTKIRVLASASPDGYSRIVELEAWTGPSPASRYDLALGATATASTSYPGWGASAVVNGDRKSLNAYSNGAWSSAAANNFPEWVQVDFGANKTINEIHVFTLQDNWAGSIEPTEAMTFTLYGLSGYDVQYWNGSSWVTVPGGSVTGNNKIWRTFTFSAITTSKIRVLSNAAPDGVSRVTEIEAYGPAESGGAGVQWLVSDHLGTPRMIFDQTGNLANMRRHDYLPFGEELVSQQGLRSSSIGYSGGDGVRQNFTAKERDIETGLDYVLARYYSSAQGRFTSVDPENYQALRNLNDPQSWNAYSYVNNSPLGRVDPDGRGFLSKLGNWLDYGIWGEEADVQKAETERRAYLQSVADHRADGVLYVRSAGSDGPWFALDIQNLSRDDVFSWYRVIKDSVERDRIGATLTPEEAASAPILGSSPGLRGDPYHPQTVQNRQAEWDALKRQMQVPLAKKLGLNVNSPTSQQLLDNLDSTVGTFIGQHRQAGIRAQLPSEFLSKTVREALESGNSTVRKLLVDSRWAK